MSDSSYTIHQQTWSFKVFWGQNITTNANTCTQTCHSWSKNSLLRFTCLKHEDHPPSIQVNQVNSCTLASSNWKWVHISKPKLPQMLDVVAPLLHFCHSPPPCLCLHLLLCPRLPNSQQSCCYDTAERVNSLWVRSSFNFVSSICSFWHKTQLYWSS